MKKVAERFHGGSLNAAIVAACDEYAKETATK